eukprot:776653-Pyramimonas_sp.AAC.1
MHSSSCRGCGLVNSRGFPGVAFVASVSQIVKLSDRARKSSRRASCTSRSAWSNIPNTMSVWSDGSRWGRSAHKSRCNDAVGLRRTPAAEMPS